MSTELSLEIIFGSILFTTVLYAVAVGHCLMSQKETYYTDMFRKVLLCMLSSVAIVTVIYIIAYLCVWIMTMNVIKSSSIHDAEIEMLNVVNMQIIQ